MQAPRRGDPVVASAAESTPAGAGQDGVPETRGPLIAAGPPVTGGLLS